MPNEVFAALLAKAAFGRRRDGILFSKAGEGREVREKGSALIRRLLAPVLGRQGRQGYLGFGKPVVENSI